MDRGTLSSALVSARHAARSILLAGLILPFFSGPAQAPSTVEDDSVVQATDDNAFGQALAAMRYKLPPQEGGRYTRLFTAAETGDGQTVNWIASQIQDRRLIGPALAARYLVAGAQASFAELRGWLDLYADLPQADAIYRLAQSKRPAGTLVSLPQPKSSETPAAGPTPDPDAIGSTEPRSAAGERAAGHFFAGDDKGALTEAMHAINLLGDRASTSHWIAGLAAWRMDQFAEAGTHFAALAQSHTATGWMLAAGAYWAGRVEEQHGATAAADKWFVKASRYRTTFYGMLAMRKLGLDIAHEISAASLTPEHLDILASTPGGYRAVALLEIGRRDLAAQELERIDPAGDPRMEEALIVVADAAHLGDLSLDLARRIATSEDPTDINALFPIPKWQPRGGFRVDPALVYAVARQESAFDPKAVSPAGAAGLMQLMPRTAEAIGGSQRQNALFDPATNLDLGQRYLAALMDDPAIGENLLLLAIAYNTGSGNLAKFRHVLEHGDPLMAMESVPKNETRGFIERVLANYWIYRAKMGADTSSLTDLADGRWPLYRWEDAAAGTSVVSSNVAD